MMMQVKFCPVSNLKTIFRTKKVSWNLADLSQKKLTLKFSCKVAWFLVWCSAIFQRIMHWWLVQSLPLTHNWFSINWTNLQVHLLKLWTLLDNLTLVAILNSIPIQVSRKAKIQQKIAKVILIQVTWWYLAIMMAKSKFFTMRLNQSIVHYLPKLSFKNWWFIAINLWKRLTTFYICH